MLFVYVVVWVVRFDQSAALSSVFQDEVVVFLLSTQIAFGLDKLAQAAQAWGHASPSH